MISVWAFVGQPDVEAYAGTLILPPYLSHLHLGAFEFSGQAENRDGREPLRLTYLGDGRLEEYPLFPEDHALAMICLVCPGIDLPNPAPYRRPGRSSAAGARSRY